MEMRRCNLNDFCLINTTVPKFFIFSKVLSTLFAILAGKKYSLLHLCNLIVYLNYCTLYKLVVSFASRHHYKNFFVSGVRNEAVVQRANNDRENLHLAKLRMILQRHLQSSKKGPFFMISSNLHLRGIEIVNNELQNYFVKILKNINWIFCNFLLHLSQQ